MAYRGPRFMLHHSAAAVVGSIIGTAPVASGVGAGPTAAASRARIADSKLGRIVRLNLATGDAWMAWDGGAGHPGLDRLIIPAGHNLATACATVELRSKGTAFTGPTEGTLRESWTPTTGQQSRTFTAVTDRYLALVLKTLSAQPELGEVFASQTRTPQRGPSTPWLDTASPNLVRTETRERDVFLVARPALRRIVWRFERVDLPAGDLTLFSELALAARMGIVYVDPPGDDASPPPPVAYWAEVTVEQEARAPRSSGLSYSADVSLLEAL